MSAIPVVGAPPCSEVYADTGRSSNAIRRAATLLDTVSDNELQARLRERLETDTHRISDLHLWQVGPGHHAAIVSIVTDAPEPPQVYKSKLANLPGLSHVTVEVERCTEEA